MNCVLFAKMDQVFSKENKTLKKYWKIRKILEKSGKIQGILSVRKSGNLNYGWENCNSIKVVGRPKFANYQLV